MFPQGYQLQKPILLSPGRTRRSGVSEFGSRVNPPIGNRRSGLFARLTVELALVHSAFAISPYCSVLIVPLINRAVDRSPTPPEKVGSGDRRFRLHPFSRWKSCQGLRRRNYGRQTLIERRVFHPIPHIRTILRLACTVPPCCLGRIADRDRPGQVGLGRIFHTQA